MSNEHETVKLYTQMGEVRVLSGNGGYVKVRYNYGKEREDKKEAVRAK